MIKNEQIFPGLLVTLSYDGARWCDNPELTGFTFRLEQIGPDWMILRHHESVRALAATFVPGTTREQMIEILTENKE